MTSDLIPLGANTRIEVGVSEPSDFFLEAGDGPYFGTVSAVDAGEITIQFDKPLTYHGSLIETCIAKPRYQGESFSSWDGNVPRIVNLVVNVPAITHLIGGIRRRRA